MSTTALKILALLFMTIDHTASFIPNMPIWFHYIGRLSYPLFAFCSAWGFYYTHDKKAYMKNMYKFSLLMCCIDILLPELMYLINPSYQITPLTNNIFSSILFADIIIYLIEISENNSEKRRKYIKLFIAYQFFTVVVYHLIVRITISIADIPIIPDILERFTLTAMCSVMTTEGAFYLTLLIPLFYFSMHNKSNLTKNYIIYNILFFTLVVTEIFPRIFTLLNYQPDGNILLTILAVIISSFGFQVEPIDLHSDFMVSLLEINYQWIMIFALPFILMYNGKKGRGMKKLFYIYYPIHIILLYIIGILIS